MRSALQQKNPKAITEQQVLTSYNKFYELKRLTPDPEVVLGFELDSGVTSLTADNVTEFQNILGWIQVKDMLSKESVSIYLEQGGNLEFHPFNVVREDVIEYFKCKFISTKLDARCGFDFSISLTGEAAILGVEIDGIKTPLYRFVDGGQSKVLKGKDDWLFLQNDVNQSIAQFTGEKRLTSYSRWRWNTFIKSIKNIDVPTFLLLVPSKETVYYRYYPISNKGMSPAEELVNLYGDEAEILFPRDVLSQSDIRSYRKNDTHWSLWGAWLVTQKIILNLIPEQMLPKISPDNFTSKPCRGDLGDKLYPPIISNELNFAGRHYSEFVYYDNQLPNFGRVMALHNDKAITNKKLLIFGSSSGYFMLYFLVLVFRDIVFVHTSGSIDKTLYEACEPDVMLLQTNARFVTKHLQSSISLKKIMLSKLKVSPKSKVMQIKSYVLNWQSDKACSGVLNAHSILVDLLKHKSLSH